MFKAFEFCLADYKVPAGPEWLHEIKQDARAGDRVLTDLGEDEGFRLNELAGRYKFVAHAVASDQSHRHSFFVQDAREDIRAAFVRFNEATASFGVEPNDGPRAIL